MAAAAFVMMASAAMKAYGDKQAADAQSEAARYNQQRAYENAQLSQQQADGEARRAQIQAGKVLGQARANVGGSGIQMDGSALDVMRENASNAELDVQTIKQGGYLKSKGYYDSAGLDSMRARYYDQAGYMSAAGDLLSGAGKAYGMKDGSYD